MQVFKLCLNIIRKNKISMLVYVFVFLGIAIIISLATTKSPISVGYDTAKADAAFFSEENTPLVGGLKQELSKSANFVSVADNTEALQDALYFRDVTYIVRVPKGFTEHFLNGENVQIEKTTVPDSVYSTYLDMKVNRYLNTAALYVKSEKGITQEQLVSRLKNDLAKSASVTMNSTQKSSNETQQPFTSYYFDYLAYVLPAVLIFGVSVVMQVFNNKDLRRRNFCSPMTPRNCNMQFLLAIGFFSVACWLVLLLPCAVLDPKHFFSQNTSYQAINSFAFLLTAVGISYLIGNLVESKNAVPALANVCALGPSFIAGVFIPQKFLSDSVLKIASFTPTYWYVKANETLSVAKYFNGTTLSPVYGCILVELAFAAAFFSLGFAASKRKRTGE